MFALKSGNLKILIRFIFNENHCADSFTPLFLGEEKCFSCDNIFQFQIKPFIFISIFTICDVFLKLLVTYSKRLTIHRVLQKPFQDSQFQMGLNKRFLILRISLRYELHDLFVHEVDFFIDRKFEDFKLFYVFLAVLYFKWL